jgi:hypothetical protein
MPQRPLIRHRADHAARAIIHTLRSGERIPVRPAPGASGVVKPMSPVLPLGYKMGYYQARPIQSRNPLIPMPHTESDFEEVTNQRLQGLGYKHRLDAEMVRDFVLY